MGQTEKTEPIRDARDVWVPFALHPISLEAPLAWHPLISDWTGRSGHVRWETLTASPLDLNWLWERTEDAADLSRGEHARLEAAWKRETGTAAEQAKAAGVEFRWAGEARSAANYAGLEAEGTVRDYTWDGLPGALGVLCLKGPGRRAFVSVACCPPVSCREPGKVPKHILGSLRLAAEDAPAAVATPGLFIQLPPSFRLDGVRGREGHFYVDLEAPGQRLTLARLSLAEWHLAGSDQQRVYAALAKVLFDRSEPREGVTTTVQSGSGFFGSRAREKDPPSSSTEVQEHPAALFIERRGCHVRFGDWVVRKLVRKWAGGAAVLTWHCPETHSLWALCARAGRGNAEALARETLRQVGCHGRPEPGTVDWAGYTREEARPRPGDALTGGLPTEKERKQNPAALRRRQLRFRVRSLPEARLEPSSKDGTGDLVYQAIAPDGFLARVLRAGAKPQPVYRRLALDAIGRRTWEGLADAPPVGSLLADVSRQFAVHPVEMFPKLLAFLKMLGERRLVEGVLDEAEAASDVGGQSSVVSHR